MRIALDFDGTFTLAPPFWSQFIRQAQDEGHEVICVTMRYPAESIEMPHQIEVIYTSRMAKAKFMEMAGRTIDVWIDDKPHWITQSSV